MGNLQIITAQFGARHNYAVPAALAGSGNLKQFYTDICGAKGVGRLATVATRVGFTNASTAALAARQPPAEVVERTMTFDRFALRLRSALNRASPIERLKLWDEASTTFGQLIADQGLGDVDVLYGMMNELGPLYEKASKSGIKTAADICVAPSWERLVIAEQRRFPSWAAPQPHFVEALGEGVEPYRYMFGNLGLWVCPSEFVRQDLVQNFAVSYDDTVVVPYAVADHWLSLKPSPQKGRILFVGTANLRKGIHHFAAAAEMLQKAGDTYDFRVAGAVSDEIKTRDETKYLTFLGQVPRDRVQHEFQHADVFVLPSIAEGSAGVVYEALAAGLPVVTTRAAGSVVQDGGEGYVLETANAEELADAISRIVADRSLRNAMAERARRTARDYSWPNFQDRLSSTLIGKSHSEVLKKVAL